jgi:hypothetical protein
LLVAQHGQHRRETGIALFHEAGELRTFGLLEDLTRRGNYCVSGTRAGRRLRLLGNRGEVL